MTTRRLIHRSWFIALLLLASIPAIASAEKSLPQGKELTAILEKVENNYKKNTVLQRQFTSDELYHNQNWEKNGKQTLDETSRYENLFVEDLPYRKLVERNGKPLTGKDAQKEQERYDKAVSERKAMTTSTKRMSLHRSFHYSLPIAYLSKLFTSRTLRVESVNGRDAWVVESTPRTDLHPADENEKSSMNSKQTTWIDCEDLFPVRFVAEKLNSDNHTEQGFTHSYEFQRREDKLPSGATQTVWLLAKYRGEGIVHILFITRRDRSEQSWSNFKKFQVDVRLLEGDVEEVGGAESHP